MDEKKLKILVHAVYPFDEAIEAFRVLHEGRIVGKVVVKQD